MIFDEIDSLQKQALAAVLEPDMEAFIRKIYRWYSRSFYTPLHVVEEMPLEYVAMHYFEYYYENMDEEDRMEVLQELSMTPEDREKKKMLEEKELRSFNEKAVKEELEKKQKKNKTRFITELKNVKTLKPETQKIEPPTKPFLPATAPEEDEVKIVFTDKDIGND